MGTIASWVIVVAIGAVLIAMRARANALTSRNEYRNLFKTSHAEYLKSQEQIQGLILAANARDLALDRATQSLDTAGTQMVEQTELITTLDEKLRLSEGQYIKLLSQKKSSEVRLGQISEQLAPFLEGYPFDPKSAKFLGDPIDFCHFLDDKIVFVEVKSGKSQLSKRQREIRDLIKAGKVDFFVYRVEGK
jgi:predicted Holliday junction resolvase-like endonuclease